jgi:acyl-coenzyme A thioesterase PaaI-like protein
LSSVASDLSLQQRYYARGGCFGCGPANEKGLRIQSYPDGLSADCEVRADWRPQGHHEAFAGVLNGGIIGTLLDCHSNWTAAWHLMQRDGLDRPPFMVTADFHVKLRRPTPMDVPLRLIAKAVSSDGSRVEVEARIEAGSEVTARCVGHFVAVGPDHPAYERW